MAPVPLAHALGLAWGFWRNEEPVAPRVHRKKPNNSALVSGKFSSEKRGNVTLGGRPSGLSRWKPAHCCGAQGQGPGQAVSE